MSFVCSPPYSVSVSFLTPSAHLPFSPFAFLSHFTLCFLHLLIPVGSFPLLSPCPVFTGFEQADFKRGVVSIQDLRVGAVLTGRVNNTTLFGAFVDIGVGHSGLIHKSKITATKLPPNQRRSSLALGPGERVEVRVLNIDPVMGRIGLDLLRVLQ